MAYMSDITEVKIIFITIMTIVCMLIVTGQFQIFVAKLICSIFGHNYITFRGYDNIWDREAQTNVAVEETKCLRCDYSKERYDRDDV